MRWWWWAAIAAVVAAAAWWARQAKLAADGKLNTTGAPAGAGLGGQLAALLSVGKPAASPSIKVAEPTCKVMSKSGGCSVWSDRILPAVVPTPIGYGTVAPLSLMNSPAPVAVVPASTPPPPKKKLPPGSKCPAGQTPMAFKSGSESWVECKTTKVG